MDIDVPKLLRSSGLKKSSEDATSITYQGRPGALELLIDAVGQQARTEVWKQIKDTLEPWTYERVRSVILGPK